MRFYKKLQLAVLGALGLSCNFFVRASGTRTNIRPVNEIDKTAKTKHAVLDVYFGPLIPPSPDERKQNLIPCKTTRALMTHLA